MLQRQTHLHLLYRQLQWILPEVLVLFPRISWCQHCQSHIWGCLCCQSSFSSRVWSSSGHQCPRHWAWIPRSGLTWCWSPGLEWWWRCLHWPDSWEWSSSLHCPDQATVSSVPCQEMTSVSCKYFLESSNFVEIFLSHLRMLRRPMLVIRKMKGEVRTTPSLQINIKVA